MTSPQPLSGVRVLDLTNVLSGPYAAYQLGLMGAEVIKVEVPGSGDLARQLGADGDLNARLLGASFLAQNAQKRSITVDLKSEAGKEVFTRLLADADVLVENFRPGVIERLGVGWEVLQGINPRLVYCAISGFGQTGPLRAKPAYDQIIQGASGMMSVTGTPETAPLRTGYPIADTLGGLAAAFAISGALYGRERTGQGQSIDVSMLETAATALGWVVSNELIAGVTAKPVGNDNATAAPSGAFATADGVINIAANKQEQFEALCRVIDRSELAGDPRFAAREDRKARRAELTALIEAELRGQPTAHWEAAFAAAGVPAAGVLSVPEMLDSEQIRHRELVHELPFPGGGTDRGVQVLGNGIRMDGEASRPTAPPPLLGEHTDEILAEIGYTPDQITRLHEDGAV